MDLRHAVDVDAGAERAFGVLADVARWPDFMSALRSVRTLDGGGDGLEVELDEKAGLFHDRPVFRVRFDAPRGLRAVQRRGRFRSCEVAWSIRPRAGGSRVTVAHRFELGWPVIGGLVERAVVGPWIMTPTVARSLANFKALVESAGPSETR
jgi:ribosome-associated toxin RatA of RatAB toxin-antitoxin module